MTETAAHSMHNPHTERAAVNDEFGAAGECRLAAGGCRRAAVPVAVSQAGAVRRAAGRPAVDDAPAAAGTVLFRV